MWIAIGCGVGVVVLLSLYLVFRRRGTTRSMVSIAMLRSSGRRLSEADVRGAFRRAYGCEPELHRLPGEDPEVDLFAVRADNIPPMGVINCRKRYMSPEEASDVADHLEDQGARAALTDHIAWSSVDALGIDRSTQAQRAAIYPLIAKLAAEFYDDACLLLYLPADQRICRPGAAVEQQLKAGQIDELFGDEALHAPMYQVSDDDAQIEAAIREAKSRLPEFLSAFEARGAAAKAMFKARFPIDGGGVEVIWLSLNEVTETELVGVIENPPIAANLPRKGETARVQLDAVVDWAYLGEGDEPVGMFVDRILLSRKGP